MKERYFIVFWKTYGSMQNCDISFPLEQNIKNDEESVKIHLSGYEIESTEIINEYNFPNMIILKSTDENISESKMSYLFSKFFVINTKFTGNIALFVKEISSPYPILGLKEGLNNHI